MLPEDTTVVVDCPPGSATPALRIGGMTVLERILREAAGRGARRALVRGAADLLPPLPPLPLAVDTAPPGTPLPDGAAVIPGDVLAGVPITDAASRRAASRALLQSCRRSYDGPGDRFVIRPISLRITSLLTRLPVTPNQVTVANILVGLAACVFAAWGGRAATASAGALIFLQVVLDSSDGELARLRHLGSRLGMWLDNLSDDVIDNLFVAALGSSLGGPWRWVGLAAAAARGATAVVVYRSVAAAGSPGDAISFRWWFDRHQGHAMERMSSPGVGAALRSLGRRDVYPLVWAAACAAGLPQVAFGLGVLICAGYFALTVAHVALVKRPG